ncbi:hypothetical protein JG688_00002708 [Phytophthora aleatoria]|uniref:Chorein N-terminal domain-containing protein n=1 Tax=Phytophthora aleatoria TaxID=2496075 RepID=A0A8J5JAV6_9STRA|nr:hypothetical protein JG688_00002708 [Phytophthora aleatoria]
MIFEVLQQILNEFFVDVQEHNVSFYAGDLFEPSHFKLSDVFLQTSLINSLQLPFELSAGYLGNVTVEGLVGAVAGWPLEVSVSDLCLVLKPKMVQWENELLIRYTRELLVAICQCFGRPAAVKKDNTSFISPAKWIWSRIKAVGADMIIQLERIHIRVESPRSDNLVAYGLYIPLIRFAPREVEEQILYRRQQPGVVYPKASDNFMSKLLTVENVSFYTDLDASTYFTAPKKTETTIEAGTLELNLSAYTSHIEKALRGQVPRSFEAVKPSETREDVNVMLPTMICRLQNRPAMNECILDVAGARVVYRSTKQGRAAVIRHLAHLFKL